MAVVGRFGWGVLAAFVLAVFIHTGWAITCYQCNSFDDPGCADFFVNTSYVRRPCPSEAKYCRKIVQEAYYEDQWHLRYIRQCALDGELDPNNPALDWHCYDKVGTFRVKVKYCHCRIDGCNGASTNAGHWMGLMALAGVVTLVTKMV